jgi:hypothetical protein
MSKQTANTARRVASIQVFAGKTSGNVEEVSVPSSFHRSRLLLALVVAFMGIGSLSFAQQNPTIEEITEAWLNSPHAKKDAEAFTHWDDEATIPPECAFCHSGTGFLDYVGADSSPAGVVDQRTPTGTLVECTTCHHPTASALTDVTFPSGIEMSGLGKSAICMICHQGRESTDSVDASISGADDDLVTTDLRFLNVHYRAAAATLMGGEARGGYQYEGKIYAQRFNHPAPLDSCIGCHDPHTTQAETTNCIACHQGIDQPTAIRTTAGDIDGDGDAGEGIADEITTLHERLASAIRLYAAERAGGPIAYSPGAYPYFFADLDADGSAGPEEAVYPNRYQSWTPRLLRAAYNFQFVAKDPGQWAHNPHYAIQLLVDSLADLSESVAIDLTGIVRP